MAIKHMMYYFGLGMNNDGKNIKNSLKCTQCRKRLIMRLSGKLQSTHAQNKLSCTKTNHLRKVRLMVSHKVQVNGNIQHNRIRSYNAMKLIQKL